MSCVNPGVARLPEMAFAVDVAYAARTMSPRFIRVYGGDHSPWVQAVLLGLHLKRIPHDVVTFPPLPVFLRYGVLMPVVSIDGGPWHHDSTRILEALGFSGKAPGDDRMLAGALRAGTNRTDSAWRFWRRWSLVRERRGSAPIRMLRSALRSFTVLYFHLTLELVGRRFGHSSEDDMRRSWQRWEARFADSEHPFLGGDEPNLVDLQLFGALQCHCSIPVPPIAVLQTDPSLPRVREWIASMQRLFEDYPHLYSGVDFEPPVPPPAPAPLHEQVGFWLGSVATILAFPVTVPLWYFYMRHVRSSGKLGLPSRRRS